MIRDSTSPTRLDLLGEVHRIVVKIGSGVLSTPRGYLDARRVGQIAASVAAVRNAGVSVALVSSGAISAGMEELGFERRPRSLPDLQASAAAGQSRLMSAYSAAFHRRGIRVAQVLLTHDDLRDRERHLNARNTLRCLLERDVVPIVNENDTVSVDEIRFGDNDTLAALTTHLLRADALIILSVVPGLLRGGPGGRSEVVPRVDRIDDSIRALAGGPGSDRSVGGMLSKIEAADMVTRAGEPVIIASGREPRVLPRILAGEEIGTLFLPRRPADRRMGGRQRWIAYFHRPRGRIVVDDGARRALEERGGSLLPSGVNAVEGRFSVGDVVEIADRRGEVFARGLTNYESDVLEQLRGMRSGELRKLLGRAVFEEAVHRDNLVLL